MKIVISPAKTLDYKTTLPTEKATQPQFLEQTAKIDRKLSRMSRREISELMGISDSLAELNHSRYQEFEKDHSPNNSRQAIYAYAGDVYRGIDAYSIPVRKIDFLQENLRILSGFYGILKPLDLIQPHRLEMGTNLPLNRKKNLYEIWQKKVTSFLSSEMEKEEVLVNLASKEYFKAVDSEKLKRKIITPVFKDLKNGKLKIISIYAKVARGAMVRYIVDTGTEAVEDLKGFDYEGYRYSEKESTKENELVFTR